MKIPTLVLTAGALGLAGCATMAPAPAGPVTLTSANKAPHGSYVVDGAGRALYILMGARGPGGVDRCSGQCLTVWPPFHAAGPQVAGGRLSQRLVSVVPGHGGSHVTYAGWPLYYYHRDRVPSDTTGQGVRDTWGTWYLLSPSGEPIGAGGAGY